MMFFDACFLVQYMVLRGSAHGEIDENLLGFLGPNRGDILRDVMLLENQLPWKLVETVLRFMPGEPSISRKFVARMRHSMRPDRYERPKEKPSVEWDENYKPPHLLGLLGYYIVGRRSDSDNLPTQRTQNVSFSVSAMELGKIGITLAANKTGELIDMDLINQKGTFFPELSLAPLSLNRRRASYLVNMAALELCTIGSFSRAPAYEDSAVCSYLMLLSMLVHREEDVQELRVRGLLLGGRGLTNEEALRFFTSFHGLRLGPYYFDIMRQIEIYRDGNRTKTKLLAIFHSHKKTIAAVLTGIGAVGGIIGTLLSIKKAL
ncbi:unnamed protein product [Urochloa humidicola]